MLRERCRVVAVLAVTAAAVLAGCGNPNDPVNNPKAAHALGGWERLLTPEKMDRWRLMAGYDHAEPWTLVDGATRGRNSWIYYPEAYGDFILLGEFFCDGSSQGGIVLRGDGTCPRPRERGYELDIDCAGDGAGHLRFPVKPEPAAHGKREYPALRFKSGEWHQVRIDVQGPKIRVTLDGDESMRITDDEFARGHILLEAEPGGVRYRNFSVIRLSDAVREPVQW